MFLAGFGGSYSSIQEWVEAGGCFPSHQEGGNLRASQMTLSGTAAERGNLRHTKRLLRGFLVQELESMLAPTQINEPRTYGGGVLILLQVGAKNHPQRFHQVPR